MKPRSILVYCLMIWLTTGLVSCAKDTVTEHYTFYRPVYVSTEKARSDIKSAAATEIKHPGKIIVKDHYIFLTEIGEGVHIIDNSNPGAPQNIGFVKIRGNADIAVRGNYLYADCYTSLAVLNISNPADAQLVNYIHTVFADRYQGLASDSDKVIDSWQRIDTTVSHRFSDSFDKSLGQTVWLISDAGIGTSFAGTGGNSTGGSMARFALVEDRMYTVGTRDMKVFNTANPSAPVYINKINLPSGVETIFPYKGNLFIGAQAGMLIASIANKDLPVIQGRFWHAQVCDPVIADGNYAYVTLRSTGICGGTTNELDVLNISNLAVPALIKVYPLTGPKGLSKDGDLLFICDANVGLKIYNAADPGNLSLIKQVTGFEAYDVIAQNGIALVSAQDGLYMVGYNQPSQAKVLSKVAFATN